MLTLNVGCGDRTYDFYPDKMHKCINFDARNLEKVDVVGDVRKLPFEDNEISYILASDIIEHFPLSETVGVLTEWCRVLKANGTIEFRLPNLKKICNDYVKGVNDAKTTSWLLYGGQDYSGNFHFICFDRTWFNQIVSSIGLNEIYYEEIGNNFVVKYKKR